MNLYKHQQAIVDKNPARVLLGHEGGTGKTLTLLRLAEKNLHRSHIIFIICPKGLKEQWKGKVKEYKVINDVFILTKEEFRRDWSRLPKFNCVIIDEIHHFSGLKSQMHKSLVSYLKKHQPAFVYGGTGTPVRREPFNVYALGRIFGYCPMSYIKFREMFYHVRYLGPRMIWERNTDEESRKKLMQFLSVFTDIVRLSDCFDMPEQLWLEPEVVGITLEQKKKIEEVRLEESKHLVKISAVHQIEGGTLKGNEFRADWIAPESAKMKRIEELADEHEKLLIFMRYTLQIRETERRLRDLGYNVLTITGGNSKDHFLVSSMANAADKVVLIAQISVAAGWETPNIPFVVYAGVSYSYLDLQQSSWRVTRGNNLLPHVFLPLFGGEVDKAVWKSLEAKKDFDPLLYEERS